MFCTSCAWVIYASSRGNERRRDEEWPVLEGRAVRSSRLPGGATASFLSLLLALIWLGGSRGEAQDGYELERMRKAHQIRAQVLGDSWSGGELAEAGKETTTEERSELEAVLRPSRGELEANPFFNLWRGEAHFRRGEEAEAERCWAAASTRAGDDLFIHWLLLRDLIGRKHWQAASREIQKIGDLKAKSGPIRLPMMALVTLGLAGDLERERAFTPAAELISLAILLDPESEEARFAKARLLWESGGLRLGEVVREIGRGVAQLRDDEERMQVITANFLSALIWSLLLAFLLLVASLFVRSEPLLRHELTERLRISLPPASHSCFLAFLYLFPVLLAGWGWQLFFWTLLVFPYCLRKERLLLSLLTLSLVALPPFYRYAASVELSRHDPFLRAAREIEAGLYGKDTARWLVGYVQTHAEDPLSRFYHALLLQREGRLEEARAEFEWCAQHLSSRSAVHNNLGNIYFRLGRYEEAERAYRKALELDPQIASTHLNLSLLYAFFPDRLRLEEAQAEFKKAEALEPGITSGIESYREFPGNRFLIYQGVPPSDLAARVRERTTERDRLARSLWGGRIRFLSLSALSFLPLCILGLFWTSYWLRGRVGIARPCCKCKQPCCDLCGVTTEVGLLCAGCYAAFFSPQVRDPRARIERLLSQDRNEKGEKLKIRVLSFFPGGAWFYTRETGIGLIHASLFLFLLFSLTGAGEVVRSQFSLSRFFSTPWTAGHLICLFGLYAASLVRGWRWST